MEHSWKKEAVVYQIYPRSFCDSNGDGIGDIPGITSKADYLKELGVDVVWLSPVYCSPNDDNGYDISDYYNINPEYGTMADWEEMLKAFHDRGIKLIMDLVVNHTSDEHEWFKKSRESKDNEYSDYYIWRKGRGKRRPNNWTSFFPAPAWVYDEKRGEYYLKLFSKKQPDLNWENPKVREEVKKILRFWLDKGVDGFRCDVVNMISKTYDRSVQPPRLPDGKKRLALVGFEHYANGPRVHEFLHELYTDVFDHYDCFLVGEMPYVTPEEALAYQRRDHRELDMVFSFEHMDIDNLDRFFIRKYRPIKLKKVLNGLQQRINGKGWNTLYLENHDQPRCVSRFGSEGKYRRPSAKCLATAVYFLQGTPFLYEGQELGMTNFGMRDISEYDDVQTRFMYRLIHDKLRFPKKFVLKRLAKFSRDNARTPMQWTDGPQAGFTTGKPWQPVNSNYDHINVASAREDEGSVFRYYQKLIALRKKYPVVVYGDFIPLQEKEKNTYSYLRKDADTLLYIVCNMTAKCVHFVPDGAVDLGACEMILSNYDNQPTSRLLNPYEARVYLVNQPQ